MAPRSLARFRALPFATLFLHMGSASATCYYPNGDAVADTSSSTTCEPPLLSSPPSKASRISKPAIIGITVGSIVALLLIIALVAFLIHRSRTRSSLYPRGPTSRLSIASLLPKSREKPRQPSRTLSANSVGFFFVPARIQRRSTGWGYDFPEEQDDRRLEDSPAVPPAPRTPSPPPPTTSSTWPSLPGTAAGVGRSWSTRITSGWALRFPSVRQSRHERLRMMDGEEAEIMDIDAFAAGEKRAETWG